MGWVVELRGLRAGGILLRYSIAMVGRLCYAMVDTETRREGLAMKHTCEQNERAFGRRAPGCGRCSELASGAAPRSGWQARYYRKCSCGNRLEVGEFSSKCRSCQIKGHNCLACNCGPVCTAFEW